VALNVFNLTELPQRDLPAHSRDMQMMFQNPLASLDARWNVGSLVSEPLNIHQIGTRRECTRSPAIFR
jgi:ABC-type microcin C transport system duplicated ATPase subunit YejF